MDDRLDLIPGGPKPIPNAGSMESPGRYRIEDGRLIGPDVIYAPTSWKYYDRPEWTGGKPLVVQNHYTAVIASHRTIKDLDKLLAKAKIVPSCVDELRSDLEAIGFIPDAVSLCLQNAGKPRKASWEICIGMEKDGRVFVCQYTPNFETVGSWNAGPGKLWEWRKKYKGQVIKTLDGDIRFDGKNVQWPHVTDAHGKDRIVWSPNAVGFGIEIMNVGQIGAKRLKAHPSWKNLPTVTVGKRVYQKPSELQVQTWIEVLRAVVEAYSIPVELIGRHNDYTPKKVDPQPPFDVNAARAILTTGE